ncbi:MAG: glycoside hydrolase family 97 catalytic domain-containing protein [Prolixibacteraceae bacterium]|nr:glycoside hydrolase family 97 catalytic domain-containing protein [Prolixibacteraceae bacterium]
MKNNLLATLLIFLLISFQNLNAEEIKALRSPNGNLEVVIQLSKESELTYSFKAEKKVLIDNSPLGYAIENKRILPSEGWKLENLKQNSVSSEWKPVWGKRALVPEKYNEFILDLQGTDTSVLHSLRLEVRAYNDGVAFRYSIPSGEKNTAIASAELTNFNFANDYTAWFYNGENANIGPEKLSETNGKRFPVMTIMADKDNFLAIHEADLTTGDPLVLESKLNSTIFSVLSVPGKLEAGFHSAWRVILYGKTPGALVDSHLIELLNPPAEDDYSWVKPGVAVWDWRIDGAQVDGFTYKMNYPSWVRMVDFAAENNIRYLVLDANWYGPEHESESDPVKGDKASDVRRLLQYGKEKGVGIWLYLNDVGGRKFPIEQTLKQYGDWGAAGIKYGFMKGTPAEKNAWTRKITELCAQNHLLCDFHDGPVHPYGQMRTFPNAVTREFCHAQLDAHRVFVPSTFVTSVFVNMVAGPIDMNNGMFDLRQGKTTRVDENQPVPSTLVSEAARTLIVFSGATIIPDIPEYYKKYPDLLRFIAAQKMPWHESKTLGGEIGKYIIMARQASDNTWLVGAATNEDSRELDIPLSFLKSGKFEVTIIQDGEIAHYLTNREVMKVQKQILKSKDKVRVKLAAGGGACLIIKPI